MDSYVGNQIGIGDQSGRRAKGFFLRDVAGQWRKQAVAIKAIAFAIEFARQVGLEVLRLKQRGLRKRGFVEHGSRDAEKHTNQRSQATAQAVTRQGDHRGRVDCLDLQVVLDGLI